MNNVAASITILLAGLLAGAYFGGQMDWPEAGTVVAIAVAAYYILKKMDGDKKNQ